MKSIIILLFLFYTTQACFAQGQTYTYDRIPPELILDDPGDSRSGSCASPNGPIVCDDLSTYPSGAYLTANGCCYSITPAVKNATYCWTWTAVNTTAILDCGWSIVVYAGFSSWFSDFELYTCDPSCTLVATGLSFTGLTIGQCYTWCFDTHMSGGGPGGGFNMLCPYVIQTAPLPIVLETFECSSSSDDIQLVWETATETNCSAFNILRSTDGLNYEEIGTEPGNGTTTSPHSYGFNDQSPFPGENYYMLKQVDFFNQGESYSDVITCYSGDGNEVYIYYDLLGNQVDIQNAVSGLYIQEIQNGSRKYRQIIFR